MSRLLKPFALILLTSACVSKGPLLATSNSIGNKIGKRCEYLILNTISVSGNRDVAGAAKDSDINLISVVDTEVTHYLIYTKACTVVYGS